MEGAMMLPLGLASDREADEARGGRGTGTCARSGCAFVEEPRIQRLAPEPDVVECECAEAQLRGQHGARGIEALDDGGIAGRYPLAVRLGSVGGADSSGVDQILRSPRNPVQRTAVTTSRNLPVGRAGGGERPLGSQRDHAAQGAVMARKALEIEMGQPLRR